MHCFWLTSFWVFRYLHFSMHTTCSVLTVKLAILTIKVVYVEHFWKIHPNTIFDIAIQEGLIESVDTFMLPSYHPYWYQHQSVEGNICFTVFKHGREGTLSISKNAEQLHIESESEAPSTKRIYREIKSKQKKRKKKEKI